MEDRFCGQCGSVPIKTMWEIPGVPQKQNHCYQCGANLEPEDPFCGNCGIIL
ncbi:MAG: zinc ribbon domain-containing protein [Candidatus Hodarchaeota archaeon]